MADQLCFTQIIDKHHIKWTIYDQFQVSYKASHDKKSDSKAYNPISQLYTLS